MSRPTQIRFFNQSKNIPTILMSFPIKIWGKSVGFWVMIGNHNSSAMYVLEEKKMRD